MRSHSVKPMWAQVIENSKLALGQRRSRTRTFSQTKQVPYSLPEGFEDLKTAQRLRKNLGYGIAKCVEVVGPEELKPRECKKGHRCRSGLCPVCVRLFRKALVRLASINRWHERGWCFLTISIKSWVMQSADFRRFTEFTNAGPKGLKDIKEVNNLIMRLRRANAERMASDPSTPALLVIGSLETVFRTVDNKPDGKPFHLHLIISGVGSSKVEEIADALFGKERKVGLHFPFDLKKVEPTPEDLVSVLTYCVAQPFVKESYINRQSMTGRMQMPKSAEIAELASNLGPLTMSERLILVGLRVANGKLQHTKM